MSCTDFFFKGISFPVHALSSARQCTWILRRRRVGRLCLCKGRCAQVKGHASVHSEGECRLAQTCVSRWSSRTSAFEKRGILPRPVVAPWPSTDWFKQRPLPADDLYVRSYLTRYRYRFLLQCSHGLRSKALQSQSTPQQLRTLETDPRGGVAQ